MSTKLIDVSISAFPIIFPLESIQTGFFTTINMEAVKGACLVYDSVEKRDVINSKIRKAIKKCRLTVEEMSDVPAFFRTSTKSCLIEIDEQQETYRPIAFVDAYVFFQPNPALFDKLTAFNTEQLDSEDLKIVSVRYNKDFREKAFVNVFFIYNIAIAAEATKNEKIEQWLQLASIVIELSPR